MHLKRTGATLAAGLLTGAAALGFGLGTAHADPVDWTEDATTIATLSLDDGEASALQLPTGTFTGQVDEDAGTIVGDVTHPPFAFPIDNPLGDDPPELELEVQLFIEDIDLDWDQDDGSVMGTATLQLDLLEALGLDLTSGGCSAFAAIDAIGTYDADGPELQFGGVISGIELEGTCGGLGSIIGGMLGDINGDIETTVAGVTDGDPDDTTTTTPTDDTTTTTQAEESPAPGTSPAGGGATPISARPSYTG